MNDSGDPLVLDAIVSSDGKRAAFFKCGDYSEPHRTNNPQLVLAYELSTGRVLLDAIVRDIYRELGISADGRFLIGRANTTTVLWALAP